MICFLPVTVEPFQFSPAEPVAYELSYCLSYHNEESKVISQKLLNLIVHEYRRRLVEVFGDELDLMVLYGSQAREEAVEGSDMDVLCVMKNPFRYGDLINRTSWATAEISLKYDIVLSRVFVTREAYELRSSPFLMNIHNEQLAI
jgi:predicted nucleotidyltransferase